MKTYIIHLLLTIAKPPAQPELLSQHPTAEACQTAVVARYQQTKRMDVKCIRLETPIDLTKPATGAKP